MMDWMKEKNSWSALELHRLITSSSGHCSVKRLFYLHWPQLNDDIWQPLVHFSQVRAVLFYFFTKSSLSLGSKHKPLWVDQVRGCASKTRLKEYMGCQLRGPSSLMPPATRCIHQIKTNTVFHNESYLGKNYIIALEGLVIQKLVTPCKLLS